MTVVNLSLSCPERGVLRCELRLGEADDLVAEGDLQLDGLTADVVTASVLEHFRIWRFDGPWRVTAPWVAKPYPPGHPRQRLLPVIRMLRALAADDPHRGPVSQPQSVGDHVPETG